MDEKELIEELRFNSRWLTPEYKNSKEYRTYLETINSQLIKNTYQNG